MMVMAVWIVDGASLGQFGPLHDPRRVIHRLSQAVLGDRDGRGQVIAVPRRRNVIHMVVRRGVPMVHAEVLSCWVSSVTWSYTW
jgi:hypothetical protein